MNYSSELFLPLPAAPLQNVGADIDTLYNAISYLTKSLSQGLGYETLDLTKFPISNYDVVYKANRFHKLVAKVLTDNNGTPKAGDFVAFTDDGSGNLGIVKAINSTSTAPGLRCSGYLLSVTGGIGIVQTYGLILFGTDLVIGQRYFMSDTPGVVTGGATNQYIGVAVGKRELLMTLNE
jgi:hypothetical protein